MIILLVAIMTATVLVTTSRARTAAAQVTARVEAAGSLKLLITDPTNPELVSAAVVATLDNVTGVQAAAGVGTARDVTNAAAGEGGTRVAAWPITADLSRIAELTAGRWPREGEAIITTRTQTTLGMDAPVGAVIDQQAKRAIVGSYRPRPGFEDLDGVLITQTTAAAPTLLIVLASPAYAGPIQKLAISTIRPTNEQALQVTSPTAVADLQTAVSNDLGQYARLLTLLTMSVGAILIAIVVLSQILLQRKDIGRRRALGAPRWAVTVLVISQVAIPATIGALVGATIGLLLPGAGHEPLDMPLAAASLIVGILVATLAAIPPALIAARRDPVRVLRTA